MDFRTHRRAQVVGRRGAGRARGARAALAAGVDRADEDERTVQFVLRPDASVSNDDLPGTLDALESDGTLVQSVIGVLGSDAMLRRAATDAGLPPDADYTIESTGARAAR